MSEFRRPQPEEVTKLPESREPTKEIIKPPETEQRQPVPESEGAAPRDLKAEERVAREQDQAKIAEIRATLGLEQVEGNRDLQKYLQEYLELKEGDVERIGLSKAKDLPKNYQEQRETLNDERLDKVTIAVIPDNLWVKGSQPSESHAEKQLILVKQSYFETQENPDEIAWMLHELAHCQNFLDSESAESYQKGAQTFAFEDLKAEYPYPNNQVEQSTFTKQFQYLKKQGKSREDILAMLGKYYDQEDFPFFNRLLDSIYS